MRNHKSSPVRSRARRALVPLLFALALVTPAQLSAVQSDGVPQAESKLRGVIEELRAGHANLDQMEPVLRVAVEQQQTRMAQALSAMGQVTSVQYVGPQNGAQVFRVTFERGVSVWAIALSANGNISTLYFQPLQ